MLFTVLIARNSSEFCINLITMDLKGEFQTEQHEFLVDYKCLDGALNHTLV